MIRIIHICIVFYSILIIFCKNNDTWVDPIPLELVDRDEYPKDLFFDRIVFISMNKANYTGDDQQQKHISLGVFIDQSRIITSYNPFRELIEETKDLEFIRACYILTRKVATPTNITYEYECMKIVCGRPLIPIMKKDIAPEQWHGIDKKHSPLHDLMILRVDKNVTFWILDRETTFEERHTAQAIQYAVVLKAGPLLTQFATNDEEMSGAMKFASLGLYTHNETRRYINLGAAAYDETENTAVVCDEWLPRHWGYFICLENEERFKGFSSSAMLFSNGTLFGVGSFTMWRGKESILVFTDVRPYTEHIWHACTDEDLTIN